MKKIVVSVFILLWAVSSVHGQYYRDRTKTPEKKTQPVTKTTKAKKIGPDYDQFYYFLFDVNQPVSNKDFIRNSSSFGSKLGYRKKIDDEGRLWGGVEFGYAVYKQHIPYQAYQYGSTAISAELFNYSINTSLTGNLDYFLLPMEKVITPYAGFGIGIAYDRFSQYYNIYGGTINSFGLQLRPEVGMLIGFKENSTWRIKAAIHYDYATNQGDLVKKGFVTPGENNYNGFVNYGFQIGIVKMAW